MYAIIETGGKQYRVQAGDEFRVEKLEVADGEKVIFDKVLLVGSDDGVKVGTPLVEGASVNAKVVVTDKAKKVIVFKYKNKTKYRRFRSHRQPFSLVHIESINA